MDERFIPYSVQGAEMVQVLVREWRPDTWELSPLKLICNINSVLIKEKSGFSNIVRTLSKSQKGNSGGSFL